MDAPIHGSLKTMTDDEAKRLLQPMVDLFGAADGGIAFIRLRHQVLPTCQNAEIVHAFVVVSHFCELINSLKSS
jgi:hypothetical protein